MTEVLSLRFFHERTSRSERTSPLSHKSKSGPVRVIRTFTPDPLTPAQERARLQHKLALLEDRIAARNTFPRFNRRELVFKDAAGQLNTLLKQRDEVISLLSSFGE